MRLVVHVGREAGPNVVSTAVGSHAFTGGLREFSSLWELLLSCRQTGSNPRGCPPSQVRTWRILVMGCGSSE